LSFSCELPDEFEKNVSYSARWRWERDENQTQIIFLPTNESRVYQNSDFASFETEWKVDCPQYGEQATPQIRDINFTAPEFGALVFTPFSKYVESLNSLVVGTNTQQGFLIEQLAACEERNRNLIQNIEQQNGKLISCEELPSLKQKALELQEANLELIELKEEASARKFWNYMLGTCLLIVLAAWSATNLAKREMESD
jgi:hypothetical protein